MSHVSPQRDENVAGIDNANLACPGKCRQLFSWEKTMYKYACKDLGVDCDFSTTAKTPEEVKKAVFAHAEVAHKEMMKSMTPKQLADLEKAVEGAIKPA